MKKGAIRSEFEKADALRAGVLARAREYSQLTLPMLLPDAGLRDTSEALKAYQALGADGITNLVGKTVVALFSLAWFRFKASAKVAALRIALASEAAVQQALDEFEATLYTRELQIRSKLDTTGYRAKMRVLLEHIFVLGNGLMRMGDDYVYRCYRFDNFVQKRSSSGRILWLITVEKKDPLELTDEQFAAAELDRDDYAGKDAIARMVDLYSRCAWQPASRTWVIEQELKGHTVGTSEERISPYLAVGYAEVPGEDYSRGRVEELVGDLRSFNGLNKAILDGMVGAAKMLLGVDETKGWTPADAAKPNLSIITGRVTGDTIDGMGFLKAEKNADFSVAMQHAATIEKRLGKQLLMESTIQPEGERVTAYQVGRIARELEGALGGTYSQIADELQKPFLDRVIYQMERDNLLMPVNPKLAEQIDVQVLTGLEALGREIELEKTQVALQILAPIPGALQRFRPEWLVNTVLRGAGIDTTEALKSKEEMQEEQEAVMRMQVEAAIQQQAVATGGAVIQEGAKSAMATARPAMGMGGGNGPVSK